jgi:chaperonin GroEL
MVYRPNVDHHRCFVLLPLRAPFLGYFEKIIKPAALEVGLSAVKADDIYGTRAVIKDIWDLIWTARVVVAIVTDQNPNVNYELGMCHTLGVPTILVTERPEDVPFDYRHRRYVRYVPKEAGWEQKLFENLINTLKSALSSPALDDELGWPYSTFDLRAERRTGRLVPVGDSLGSVVRGALLVRHSVDPAFGPQGTQVSVNVRPNNRQIAYRRGYLIAQNIRSDDPLEKQGIEQMARLAGETFASVGDATKTAVLLSAAMIERGSEALARGCIAKPLISGMQMAVDAAATYIMTAVVNAGLDELRAIAETAAGSDARAAVIATEALRRVGGDGLIEIENGLGSEAELELQVGMQFEQGFLSPSFVTDDEREECVLDDCYLLLREGQIGSMLELLPLLEQIAKAGKPLLVVASDLAQEALATLIVNKQRGTLSCAAVKAPGQGDRRRALLEDMAILTGGKAFLQEVMQPLQDTTLSDLGRARRAIVTRGATTIVDGAGNTEEIASRIASLRRQMSTATSPHDLARLRERLVKLGGALAVIRSGGLTEADQIDSRYRLESALYSCQSASKNGCVAGGGLPYYRAKSLVEKLIPTNESEKFGISVVSYALEQPLQQLIFNSARADKAKVLSQIAGSEADSIGFNAETENIEDVAAAGVLDSAKALKEALLLAFAHAKGILSTGAWDAGNPDDTQES